MTTLARQRPDPIPAIHPLPEYLAEGALKANYEDMKAALQVPWMGVVTMAYAHYPTFFDVLWEGTRELTQSAPYVAASRHLRGLAEDGVAKLSPPPIAERLEAMGYAPSELDGIRAMIEVFSHGNNAYYPMVTVARLLLEGGETGTDHAPPPPFEGRHAPDVTVPFVLMEHHHGTAETQALYEDIKATLKLPFVNTDYRALARWPSYFALAWRDLKPLAGTPVHETLCAAFHERSVKICQGLPNPGRLTSAALVRAAEADAPLEEVREVAKLFNYLLPGLVVYVAFWRAQLAKR